MYTTEAAFAFTALVAIAILFQLALACGAPWGHLAMGGRYPGRFPAKLRIAACVQAGLLAVFALVVLTRAGVLWPQYLEITSGAIWFVVAVSGLSTIMNIATPSRWERILWAPITLGMLCSSGWLAFQGSVSLGPG